MKSPVFVGVVTALSLTLIGLSSSANQVRWDESKCFFVVKTGKAGRLSFLGHNHAVLATQWKANFTINGEKKYLSRGDITVQANSLVIDTPEARTAAGLDESNLSEVTKKKIQSKMLGPEILNAVTYPELRFSVSTPLTLQGNKTAFSGRLSLHGQTHLENGEAQFKIEGEKVSASGTFKFLQGRYGIPREKILGGSVEVADEVEARFRLEGQLTDQ